MFSAAVSVGMRLNAWKTKPMRSRRSFVSFFSLSRPSSTSPIQTEPLVSRSSPASVCMQRRLARARRAHDGGEARGCEVDADAVERPDFGFARAVHLGGVDGASATALRG